MLVVNLISLLRRDLVPTVFVAARPQPAPPLLRKPAAPLQPRPIVPVFLLSPALGTPRGSSSRLEAHPG